MTCHQQSRTFLAFFLPAIFLSILLMSNSTHANEPEHAHKHDDIKTNNITIEYARVNPTVPGMKVTSAYFNIHNGDSRDIKVIGAKSNITNKTEIHEHKLVNGLMKMQHVDQGIAIPSGTMVELKPGGYHIMIMNLNEPVHEGDIVEIELLFSDGTHIDVFAKASRPSANTPTKHHHH